MPLWLFVKSCLQLHEPARDQPDDVEALRVYSWDREVMPIYEFECTNDLCEANLRYEKELKINEPHDVECGFCHEPMRKIYSSFGIQFKGSGFYSTDK